MACSVSVAAYAASPKPAMPLGSPGDWVTTADYPKQALADSVDGAVQFRLDIDRLGEPSACTVLISSGSPQLDATACNLIMVRARFSPATDRRGRAVPGTYTNRVRWIIPKDRPKPEPGLLVTSVIVEPDGSVSDCRIETVEGGAIDASQAKRAAAGKSWCESMNFASGYTDAAGKTVPKRVRMTTRVEVLDP